MQDMYKFVWHKNEKYGNPISRTTWIKTAGGQLAAVNLFMQAFGNLKKNTIESAEEYTRSGTIKFEPQVVKNGNRYVAV